MNKWLFIAIVFCSSLCSFGQRPDLSIGWSGSTRFLTNNDLQMNIVSPGAFIHLQVSKRASLFGLNTGYETTFDLQSDLYTGFQHYRLDLFAGVIIIRKPAFKMSFCPQFSNLILLSKKTKLDSQNAFERYSFQIVPELNFRFKGLFLGCNYTIPISGTPLKGPGFKLGVLF